jgi:hypothetical protein
MIFAKLGFGDEQGTQPLSRNDKRLHRVIGVCVDQGGAP